MIKKYFVKNALRFFLFRNGSLKNIDNISRNLFKYSFVFACCSDEIDAIIDL